MSKTLLLVVPPQRGLLEGFSTGLISLGNYARLTDKTLVVRFLDLGNIAHEELSDRVSEAALQAKGRLFVGITGTTASYQSMLRTAACFKALDPSCIVILGGHHVSPEDDVVLRRHSSVVDFIIRGEGEAGLLKLVQSYPDVSSVPNLSWLGGNSVTRNADAPRLSAEVLDLLAPTLDAQGLRSAPGKFDHVTYVSARGCPLACAFCVVGSSKIYAKSVDAVIGDLRHLVGDLGYKSLAIEDNFFAHQPRRTLQLCSAIEKLQGELDFSWDCQTRVESMKHPNIVQAMSRAGCEAAYLGVESLVEKHLTYLAKTTRPTQYLEVLEQAVIPQMIESGIDVYMNLQLGLPGETSRDRTQTLEILRRLGATAHSRKRHITVFPQLHVVYPGTPHFRQLIDRGGAGRMGREVFEEFTVWEAEEEPILAYLGEHFAHGIGGIPLGIMDRHELAAGKFELSSDDLANVSTQLSKMATLPGIRVFKYGQYLAQPQRERALAHG